MITKLELHINEVNYILDMLDEKPHRDVRPMIDKIRDQAKPQIMEYNASLLASQTSQDDGQE